MGKNAGLSKRSKVWYGASRIPGAQVIRTKSLPLNKTKAQRDAEKEARNEQLAGASYLQSTADSLLTK